MVKKLAGTLTLGLLYATNVFAASVSLVQNTAIDLDQVQIGDTVTFDVVIDFTGDPALGGGFDIEYDSSAVVLVGFIRDAAVGDPDFSRDPDNLLNLLESWAVGDFQGIPEIEALGTVTFQVSPGMVTDTVISVSPTSGIGGPWVSGTDFLTVLNPTYNEIVVSYDTDGDGTPNIADDDDDNDGLNDGDDIGAGLDPLDPDSDDDGIGDAFDKDPLVNNFCFGAGTFEFMESVSDNLTCAATTSIAVKTLAEVLTTGDLQLIAPIVSFESGFSVYGLLTVTAAHPCPGC